MRLTIKSEIDNLMVIGAVISTIELDKLDKNGFYSERTGIMSGMGPRVDVHCFYRKTRLGVAVDIHKDTE